MEMSNELKEKMGSIIKDVEEIKPLINKLWKIGENLEDCVEMVYGPDKDIETIPNFFTEFCNYEPPMMLEGCLDYDDIPEDIKLEGRLEDAICDLYEIHEFLDAYSGNMELGRLADLIPSKEYYEKLVNNKPKEEVDEMHNLSEFYRNGGYRIEEFVGCNPNEVPNLNCETCKYKEDCDTYYESKNK